MTVKLTNKLTKNLAETHVQVHVPADLSIADFARVAKQFGCNVRLELWEGEQTIVMERMPPEEPEAVVDALKESGDAAKKDAEDKQ